MKSFEMYSKICCFNEIDKLRDEIKFMPIKEPSPVEQVDISEYVDQLEGDIKACVLELQEEK